MTRSTELVLSLLDEEIGIEALEAQTSALRDDLFESPGVLEIVNGRKSDAPSATKAPSDALDVGVMVLTVLGSSGTIAGVVELVKSWADRSTSRTAKITISGNAIELQGLSKSDQEKVIRHWLDASESD